VTASCKSAPRAEGRLAGTKKYAVGKIASAEGSKADQPRLLFKLLIRRLHVLAFVHEVQTLIVKLVRRFRGRFRIYGGRYRYYNNSSRDGLSISFPLVTEGVLVKMGLNPNTPFVIIRIFSQRMSWQNRHINNPYEDRLIQERFLAQAFPCSTALRYYVAASHRPARSHTSARFWAMASAAKQRTSTRPVDPQRRERCFPRTPLGVSPNLARNKRLKCEISEKPAAKATSKIVRPSEPAADSPVNTFCSRNSFTTLR